MNISTCFRHAAAPVRLLCLFLFCLLAPALRAQSPIHVYEFDGNLDDALGGYAMSSGGGTTEAFRYAYGAGQGPSVPWAVPTSGDYSLEMVFTFTSVPAYACLVNFSDLQQDAGIYIGDGALPYLAPSGGTASGFSVTPLTANVPVRVVVTRNWSTQETKIYMNGTLAKTKSDTGNIYVPPASGVVHFFRDNTAGNYQGENAPGSVDKIRIYNYVLTSGQVQTLGGPSPEIQLFLGATRLGQGSDAGMGSVNLGQTSAGQTFTVRNSGPVNLSIPSVAISSGAADFFTSAPGTTVLAQGQTTTFQAWFSPSATGYRTGSLTISNNDPSSIFLGIGLNGTGVAGPPLAPAHEFEFTQSYADSVAIGNEVIAPQSGGTLAAATHTFPANGYLTGPANLVSNQYEYTLEVVFRLDAISGYRSVINFDGMAGDDAVFVQDGKIRFFSLVNVQPSVAAPVTAAGWHRLIVTRKAVNNELIAYVDGVAVLTTTDQNNRYVADTRVRFFGDSTPDVSAGVVSLIRSYNGVMPPAQVTARGAGTLPEIQVQEGATLPGVERADNAAAYAMPTTATGNSSASRSFVIANTGNGTLAISSMTVGGSHPGDFAVTNAGAVNLATGNTRVLGVTFTPTALGTRTATIIINSNDADEQPFEINLTATGVVPPTVTAISPNSGTAAGGTQVTLTGTGFTGATGVTIGGTAATGVSVVNATTITCTTAARAAGPFSVQVQTPVGTNAANTLYSYKAVTTTSLVLTGGTVPYGQAYPVTVTVNATAPHLAPVGAVSLKEGATIVASSTRATPGTWTFTPVGLNAGAHTLTAQYDGDAWNLLSASAGSVTFTVTQATGALAVTSSLNPMTQGDAVTYTATLTPPLNNVTITFKDGTTSLGSAATNAAGVASLAVTPPMTYGTRSITAVFAGNANVSLTTSPVLSQVVNQNANAIVLTNLTHTYNGSPKSASAITVPAGLPVTFTYNGSATAPTAVGSYAVVGTINHSFWGGTATGTFTINKGNATVTITGTNRIFDGTPKPVTVTTVPAGLSRTITYNGSTTAPSALGSYAVVVTVTDPNWNGSATDTLNISNAAVTTTTLTSSVNPSVFQTQPTFTARATSTTAGLTGQMALLIDNVQVDSKPVDASGYATFTPTADQLRGGARTIRAVYNGTFAVIEFASSNATITQTVNKLTWPVTLGSLSQVYDGTARVATANITPPATHPTVAVDFTYDGSPVQPVNAGSYAVVATINDPSLQGTASGTLIVAKAPALAGVTSPPAVGYDGLPHPVELTPTPVVSATVAYQLLVNGTPTGVPTATPPSAVGNYRAFLTHANYTLTPATTDFTITGRGVSITLGELSVVANGTPRPVTLVTDPPGINVAVTYQDGAGAPTATPPSTPPPGGGTWTVNANVTDASYSGTATAQLLIRVRQTPVLTVTGPAATYPGPVTYTVTMPTGISGFAPPGEITFKQDGVALGAARLSANGSCTWFPTLPARGPAYSMTAEYEGDPDYFPATSSPRLTTVSKRTVTVRATSPLTFTYDRSPKPVAFTTDFSDIANIPLVISYGGSPNPPVNAMRGIQMNVTASVDPANPDYQGTVSVSLQINPAPATIQLEDMDQIYVPAWTTYPAFASTQPSGLLVALTYNGSSTVPSGVGEYAVQGTLFHSIDRNNYEAATATGTLRITDSAVRFDITGSTAFEYDGNPKPLSITAIPAIRYYVTYNGGFDVPRRAGRYEVIVGANQAPYTGRVSTYMDIVGSISATSWDGTQAAAGTFKLDGYELLEPGAPGTLEHFPVWRPAGTVSLEFVGKAPSAIERYRFKQWEDGDRDNPRSIQIGGPWHPGRGTYKAIAVREMKLIATANPPAGGIIHGGADWKTVGDLARFAAIANEGHCLVGWTYNNTTYPVKFIEGSRIPELAIQVVGGAAAPVANFSPGYIAEAVADRPQGGSAKCVRTDRQFEDTPVQSIGLPYGASFTAIATPAPGYRFDHWNLTGAKSPLAGNSAVHALKYDRIELVPATPTTRFAQAIPSFIIDRPEFDATVTENNLINSSPAFGVFYFAGCHIELENVGGRTAENVKITGVEVSGYCKELRDGGYDWYYPIPNSSEEDARNAAFQIPQSERDRLEDNSPTMVALFAPYDYGYMTKGATESWPVKFHWPAYFWSGADYLSTGVRLKLTITYDGGSTTAECWTDMKIGD